MSKNKLNNDYSKFKPAPILITVYDRLDKLKDCINSLLKNELSKHTIVYISSDNYSKTSDQIKVNSVREYINSIKGFKKVVKVFHEKNLGGSLGAELSRKIIFENHDKYIFLEDDIVVSPLFLDFMNTGLEFYKNDTNIFSICGFSPYIFSNNYNQYQSELFKSNRWNAWGFGFWKEKYESSEDFRKSESFFNELEKDLKCKTFKKKINLLSKEYFPHLLYSLKKRKLPEYDFLIGYYCVRNELFNIYFSKTHTINTGNDGSGLRAKKNDFLLSRMNVNNFIEEKVVFIESEKIVFTNFMPRPPAKSIIIKIKIILIQLNIFDFTKKLIKQLKF